LHETGHNRALTLDVGVGLVLSFRDDRVSRIDGHITDPDAYFSFIDG
jgi:hypothetical protein